MASDAQRLTIEQAAAELGVVPKTVRRWIARGWLGEATKSYDATSRRLKVTMTTEAVFELKRRMAAGELLPLSTDPPA